MRCVYPLLIVAIMTGLLVGGCSRVSETPETATTPGATTGPKTELVLFT